MYWCVIGLGWWSHGCHFHTGSLLLLRQKFASGYCVFSILGECGSRVSWWGHCSEPAAGHEIAFTLKGRPGERWGCVERPGTGQRAITKGWTKPWRALQTCHYVPKFFSVSFYRRKSWSSQWLNDLLKKVWSRNKYNPMVSDSESLSTRQHPKATPSSFPLRLTLSLLNLSRFFRLALKLIKVSFPNCTIKINYVHKLEGKEIAFAFWVPW